MLQSSEIKPLFDRFVTFSQVIFLKKLFGSLCILCIHLYALNQILSPTILFFKKRNICTCNTEAYSEYCQTSKRSFCSHFWKILHLRYLTGFGIHLWKYIWVFMKKINNILILSSHWLTSVGYMIGLVYIVSRLFLLLIFYIFACSRTKPQLWGLFCYRKNTFF